MLNQQIKTRAWTRTKLTLLVTGVKHVKSLAWVKPPEEKRLQERRGRPKEIGLDQSVDQDAERRRRVVESSVQAEEIEEPQTQFEFVYGSDQDLFDVGWFQSPRDEVSAMASSSFFLLRDRERPRVRTVSSPAYTCLQKTVSCVAKISDVSCVY